MTTHADDRTHQPGDMEPSGDIEVRLPERLQKMLTEKAPWVPLVGLYWGDPSLQPQQPVKKADIPPSEPVWIFGALYGVDTHGICHVAVMFYPFRPTHTVAINDLPISAALKIVRFGKFNPKTGAMVFHVPKKWQWQRPAGGTPIVEL